jgi:hypothetical protein
MAHDVPPVPCNVVLPNNVVLKDNVVSLREYRYKRALSRGRVPLVRTLPNGEDMEAKLIQIHEAIERLKQRILDSRPTTQVTPAGPDIIV